MEENIFTNPLKNIEHPNNILPVIDSAILSGEYELACSIFSLWRYETLRREEESRKPFD